MFGFAVFADRALRRDDSLFTQGTQIWTLENLDDLHARFNEQPDASSSSFEEKFRHKLSDAPAPTVQLAGELIYFHLLIAGDMTGETKRSLVRRVLGWSDRPVDLPEGLSGTLDMGICNTGVAFKMRPACVGPRACTPRRSADQATTRSPTRWWPTRCRLAPGARNGVCGRSGWRGVPRERTQLEASVERSPVQVEESRLRPPLERAHEGRARDEISCSDKGPKRHDVADDDVADLSRRADDRQHEVPAHVEVPPDLLVHDPQAAGGEPAAVLAVRVGREAQEDVRPTDLREARSRGATG